jgi:hypothetical protein
MDLSAVIGDLSVLVGSNLPIIIGVLVTLAVMGLATLYDKRKGKEKTPVKSGDPKPSSLNLSQQVQDLNSKYTSNFSEYGKKLSSLIPKKEKKQNLGSNEINPLKSAGGIPKIFGTVRSKISTFSSNLGGKKTKLSSEKPVLQPNKKADASKFSGNEKINSFEIDQLVETKKDELDFDDSVLSQMSTASSLKNNNAALLNNDLNNDLGTDLSFDKNEFDMGFGEINDESSEDESLFNSGAENISLGDESDSLLDSLKKDIVVRNEKKIDFMTEMQGENLDITVIKSELQEAVKRLKYYRQITQRS